MSAPDDNWQDRYLAIGGWVGDLKFLPPAHFKRIATTVAAIKRHLENLIRLEPPADSSEVDEEESIVVKHGRGSPKVIASAGEVVASSSVASFVQNETKVSRFILCHLDSHTNLFL